MSKENIETINTNKGRRLVVGDVHGGLLALKEVMEKAEVTTDDQIIFLGDYVDGWADSFNLINYLIDLNITHDCIFLRGNHDAWLEGFLTKGFPDPNWLNNGGKSTLTAYEGISEEDLKKHSYFFRHLHNYYLSDDNIAFVHGGYVSREGVQDSMNDAQDYYWDRMLLQTAVNHEGKHKSTSENYNKYFPKILAVHKEIYVGHTNTLFYGMKIPFKVANLTNMDTAAGYKGGKLSIMDVDTREYWQSSLLEEHYPTDPHTLYGRQ